MIKENSKLIPKNIELNQSKLAIVKNDRPPLDGPVGNLWISK
jgi:hypothetical protein